MHVVTTKIETLLDTISDEILDDSKLLLEFDHGKLLLRLQANWDSGISEMSPIVIVSLFRWF
jgi:hypothetical protein